MGFLFEGEDRKCKGVLRVFRDKPHFPNNSQKLEMFRFWGGAPNIYFCE